MRKYEVIILVSLLAFGALIFVRFTINGGSVSDSIYPELVGFSLEGVIFVILFTWFQRREESRSKLDEKSNIKRSMRAQLAIFFQWAQPLSSDVVSIKLCILPKALKTLRDEIKEQDKLTDLQPAMLISFAYREISSLEALSTAAANIDEWHLLYWSSIINNLKGVRDSKSEDRYYKCPFSSNGEVSAAR